MANSINNCFNSIKFEVRIVIYIILMLLILFFLFKLYQQINPINKRKFIYNLDEHYPNKKYLVNIISFLVKQNVLNLKKMNFKLDCDYFGAKADLLLFTKHGNLLINFAQGNKIIGNDTSNLWVSTKDGKRHTLYNPVLNDNIIVENTKYCNILVTCEHNVSFDVEHNAKKVMFINDFLKKYKKILQVKTNPSREFENYNGKKRLSVLNDMSLIDLAKKEQTNKMLEEYKEGLKRKSSYIQTK